MMLERMGTMGSTQGVNARPMPPMKNSAIASSSPRSASAVASRCSSVAGSPDIGADSAAGAAGDAKAASTTTQRRSGG